MSLEIVGCGRFAKGDIVLVELDRTGVEAVFLIVGEFRDDESLVVFPVYEIGDFLEEELRAGTPGILFIWEGWLAMADLHATMAQFVDHRPIWLPLGSVKTARRIGKVINDFLWAGIITELHLVNIMTPIERHYLQALQNVNGAFPPSAIGY